MKFGNSMYKLVIASCACADFSDFKYRSVKISLLNIWSEYQNLVKKLQATLKIQTIHRLNFHEVEYIHGVECTWGQNFPLFLPSISLKTAKLFEKNSTALVLKNFGKTSVKEMQV